MLLADRPKRILATAAAAFLQGTPEHASQSTGRSTAPRPLWASTLQGLHRDIAHPKHTRFGSRGLTLTRSRGGLSAPPSPGPLGAGATSRLYHLLECLTSPSCSTSLLWSGYWGDKGPMKPEDSGRGGQDRLMEVSVDGGDARGGARPEAPAGAALRPENSGSQHLDPARPMS